MNSYITPGLRRTAPQITQRHFDVLVDGVEYRAHGVKGANGEWVLEALIGRAWHDIGLAEKKDKMWDAWQGNHESLHSTLNAAIAALIAHRLTQINN